MDALKLLRFADGDHFHYDEDSVKTPELSRNIEILNENGDTLVIEDVEEFRHGILKPKVVNKYIDIITFSFEEYTDINGMSFEEFLERFNEIHFIRVTAVNNETGDTVELFVDDENIYYYADDYYSYSDDKYAYGVTYNSRIGGDK
ncbi:MAG: hypothetical protein IKA36_02025 [Clostridia bacterium]|nr:hypothetical protein [Clostridia bacterium]